MKRYQKLAVGVAAISAALFAMSGGARAAEATASATSTVIESLTVNNITDLGFGVISANGTPGTVVVDVGNVRTCNNVTCLGGGSVQGAAFDVLGLSLAPYVVTFSSGNTLTNGTGGTMDLDTFTDNSTGILDADGSTNLRVGATLNVNPNQAAGVYIGTFTVTVSYI